MMSMKRNASFHGLLGLAGVLSAALLFTACGAKQSGHGCPTVKEGLSAGSWQNWAQCVDEGRIDDPDVCRSAMLYAQGMTPTALEAATRCALSAHNREDGSLVGNTLQRVATNDERSTALARGLAPHYTNATHGARLASALTNAGELALAKNLENIPAPTRDEVIRTAFAWGLNIISDASLPYIDASDEWADALQEMAQRAANARTLNAAERLSLVVTGQWDANNILDCAEGRVRGCENADVNEAAQLLRHDTRSPRNSVGASRVMGTLVHENINHASVELVLDWVSSPTTPNSQSLMASLRNSLASTTANAAFRMSLAEGANAELCNSVAFPQMASYAVSSSREPTEAWSVFIDRCTSLWAAEDLARVLSVGAESNINDTQRQALRNKLQTELEAGTCEQVQALGERVMSVRTTHAAKRGIVWAELSNARQDCAQSLQPKLQQTAESADAHPEARLSAIVALAEQGQRQSCQLRTPAQQWNADRQGIPLGRGVQPLVERANALCR